MKIDDKLRQYNGNIVGYIMWSFVFVAALIYEWVIKSFPDHSKISIILFVGVATFFLTWGAHYINYQNTKPQNSQENG